MQRTFRSCSFVVLLSISAALFALNTAQGASCVPPPTNIVSWWRFETNLFDAWDSNPAQPVSTVPTYVGGRVGFGISNSVLSVPDSPSLRFSTGFTVAAWINVAGTNLFSTIAAKAQFPLSSIAATQTSFCFGLTNSNRLMFLVSSNGLARTNVTLVTTNALATNQWHFVAATYDNTHARLYLNGQLALSRDAFNGMYPAPVPLTIGALANPSPEAKFTGIIDEVAVYNRALSATELLSLYNADGSGMCLPAPAISGPQNQAVPLNEDVVFSASVSGAPPFTYQWRFNGTNLPGATNASLFFERVQSNRVGNYSVAVTNAVGGTTSRLASLTLLPPLPCVAPPSGIVIWWPGDGNVTDVAGNNNGEVAFTTFVTGGYGTGRVAAAFATSVRVPNSPTLNFQPQSSFSWEGWIKAPPTNIVLLFRDPTNVIILEKLGPIVPSSGYALSLRDGKLSAQLAFSGTPVRTSIFTAPTADLRDNRWHHIACSVSRNAEVPSALYVDGTNALAFDVSAFTGALSNNTLLTLGLAPSSLAFNRPSTNGTADEFTLYNRVLTGSEVASIFQASSGGKCKLPPAITSQPVSQEVIEGNTVRFTVGATGLGLKYQWRFDGTDLNGATTNTLSLKSVTPANSGLYNVRISNAFGAVTSSVATLVVHRLPIALCTNVVISAGIACSANASVNAGSYSPEGGPLELSQDPPGPYPLGTNAVILTVTDTNGATATCNSTVVVIDTTPPAISCPAAIVLEFTDISGAPASFAVSATDSCSPPVQVLSRPASGSLFPIGTSTVTSVATDAVSNHSSCAFQVTVVGAQGVLSNVLAELTLLSDSFTRPPDQNALAKALQNLADGLNPALWVDQEHLSRAHGEQVFNSDKSALQELSHLVKGKKISTGDAALLALMSRIIKADRLLASVAIADATVAGIDSAKLSHAQDDLTQGDTELADAKYEPGISHYRNAWKFAEQHTVTLSASVDAGSPTLRFEATPGDTYVVERSTNLTDWLEVGTVTADDDGLVQFENAPETNIPVSFYRVRQQD